MARQDSSGRAISRRGSMLGRLGCGAPVDADEAARRIFGPSPSLDELIGVWDIQGDERRTVQLETYLAPGDLLAPCVQELDTRRDHIANDLDGDLFVIRAAVTSQVFRRRSRE